MEGTHDGHWAGLLGGGTGACSGRMKPLLGSIMVGSVAGPWRMLTLLTMEAVPVKTLRLK